jgi:hypothetical protein
MYSHSGNYIVKVTSYDSNNQWSLSRELVSVPSSLKNNGTTTTSNNSNNGNQYTYCNQWYPSWKFNGLVEGQDSTGKKFFNENFTITVNHRDYSIIKNFDQYEGVIIQGEHAGFSVATYRSVNPFYTWMWGDNTEDKPSQANSNPSHQYNIIGNWSGALVVDSGYGNYSDLHDLKNFHVLVVSNMKKSTFDIEAALDSDPAHKKTEFTKGDRVRFDIQKVPYNPPPGLGGKSSPSWYFNDINNTSTDCYYGKIKLPHGYPTTTDQVCHIYNTTGVHNVTYSVWIGDKELAWTKHIRITAQPSIVPDVNEGAVGTKVIVTGSNFKPEGVTFLWHNKDNGRNYTGNYLVDVNSDGTFVATLTVPSILQNGSYILYAKATHAEGDEAKANFKVIRP